MNNTYIESHENARRYDKNMNTPSEMISLYCKPTNPFSKQHKRDRKRSAKQSLAHSRSQGFIK